jgi:hypothetical protein
MIIMAVYCLSLNKDMPERPVGGPQPSGRAKRKDFALNIKKLEL